MAKQDRSKVIIIALLAAVLLVGFTGYFILIPQNPPNAPDQINQGPAPPPASQPAPSQPAPAPQPQAPPDPRGAQLRQAIITHLDKLAARDVRGLMDIYIPDKAYAEWANQAGVFAGKYDGTGNIRILWAQIIGNTITIGYKIDNYDAKITGDRAEVRYKLYLNGTGKLIGDFQMEVDAIQKFIYADGKWLMDYDFWNFRVFKTSIVADGTVFPLNWRKLGDFSVWNDRIKDLFSFGRP